MIKKILVFKKYVDNIIEIIMSFINLEDIDDIFVVNEDKPEWFDIIYNNEKDLGIKDNHIDIIKQNRAKEEIERELIYKERKRKAKEERIRKSLKRNEYR